MFCAGCGSKIEDVSQFCNKCGKPVLQNATLPASDAAKTQFNSYDNLTAELRAELSKFQTHTKMACLQCGYSGLMGVTGTIVPWYLSMWLWAPLGFLVGAEGGIVGIIIAIIVGIVIAGIQRKSLKKKATCPACKAHIVSIEQI